jgi:hypothetical protein
VFGKGGRPDKRPDPKKPTNLRGNAGVWYCESSDRIKDRDGARIQVVDSLAGVDGWSVTNVAVFSISPAFFLSSISDLTYRCLLRVSEVQDGPSAFLLFRLRWLPNPLAYFEYHLARLLVSVHDDVIAMLDLAVENLQR